MKFNRKLFYYYIFATALVAVVYYGRYRREFFMLDDFFYLDNVITGGFGTVMLGCSSLRIISNTSWLPLHAIGGLDPLVYNIFSLLMHILNGVALFILIRELARDDRLAFLAGIIFSLTAAGCDAVFWKSANSTLLSFFFYISSLICYVRYRREGLGLYYRLSVAVFVIAMFCKEESASLPLVLVFIESVYFQEARDYKKSLRAAAPYIAIVLLYLVLGRLVFNVLLHSKPDLDKFFEIRPLHSLFGGWAVFVIRPGQTVTPYSVASYTAALGVVASLFWVKDRRLLLVGYGWIFLTFLPQSLSNLGQLDEGNYAVISSLSRYLYLPSAGASIIFAAALIRFSEVSSKKVFIGILAVFLTAYAVWNFNLVQNRGDEWHSYEDSSRLLVYGLKEGSRALPPNALVYIDSGDSPIRGFYLRSLFRAFYNRKDIKISPKPGPGVVTLSFSY